MRREDLGAVLEVERLSFPNPWNADHFLQELRLPFSRIILASIGDLGSPPIGHLCRWLTSGELHILNVAVHPDWRRRSIGRSLVEHALAEARHAVAARGILEVRRSNLAALRLYERMGFSRIGMRPNYYAQGEDALVMEIPLLG